MDFIQDIPELRAALAPRRQSGPIVLVPTMGALHEGHSALLRHARDAAGPSGTMLVSIFVNPTQFGPNEDFVKYPRPLARDLDLCRHAGTDLVFAPAAAELYAPDHSVRIEETALSLGLCGRLRPGHFPGVCLIVVKLFWIALPDIAVFGDKDFQQLAIIRRAVRDLNIPVRIDGVATVRDADGLALSSRNAYLSPDQRKTAPAIYRALESAKSLFEAHPDLQADEIVNHAAAFLRELHEASIDYVEIVDAESLAPLKRRVSRPALLAAAVRLGTTRLIDHVHLTPP